MRTGYGRGYYGERQLHQSPDRRRGNLWFKLAFVAGVGAVIWFLWPRTTEAGHLPENDVPDAPPPPPDVTAQLVLIQQPQQPQQPQPQPLSQVAESRGYPSQQAYEDAVVASARQLQGTGARVVLAPHLSHLTPRLGAG